MNRTITIEQARELYKNKTSAIRYSVVFGNSETTIIVFETNGLIVQVNEFSETGRKEAFTQPRQELADDLFDMLSDEENAETL